MRFIYAYRSKDNARHEGQIVAPTREAAYRELKGRGINPIHVVEAPGFFNKIIGRWKPLVAVIVIVAISAVAGMAIFRLNAISRGMEFENRAQLYGDPVVVMSASANGWMATFPDQGDAWFARHAVPGASCDCDQINSVQKAQIATAIMRGIGENLVVAREDLAEVAKMKRMVNGMKSELREYLRAGGKVETYMYRADIRQKAEARLLDNARRDLQRTDDPEKWRLRNAELRSMGLPMVLDEER